MDFIGAGTVLNVLTITAGALAGMVLGHRLPEHTRVVVTDCLGLVTLLMAALSAMSVLSPDLVDAVGSSAPTLIVLGSLLLGSVTGSLFGIERRLESFASRVQARVAGGDGEHVARERFIEGWLTATLLFCVGPLTILGSLDDGLGRGIDKLALKSVLDGFAALAFASTFGVGVLFSAVSVGVIQGGLTIIGFALGAVLSAAHIAALTATGGLILAGIALRLLRIRHVPVGDMLPALVFAPLLTQLVAVL